jgi:acyl-CoA synthetase (AMP-forming)/AMP-acid ligase II
VSSRLYARVIARSADRDVDIPTLPLGRFVLERAGELGKKVAIADAAGGRMITYAELARAVEAFAGGLVRRGFGRGDVLALSMPNLPEYAVAFHGTLCAGGVVTTVNPLFTPGELAGQLGRTGARLLLTVPARAEAAREAAQQVGLEDVLVIGEPSFETLLGSEEPAPELLLDSAVDLAALPCSSGTTGLPKAVMLTHRNLVANVCQFLRVQHLAPRDTVVAVLPFFHIYGMTVIMNAGLRAGATIVTMPRFELEDFLRTIQDHRVTRAYVIPPIVLALAKHPAVDRFDLSSLEFVFSGAAPLSAELAKTCAIRLGCPVLQGYGLTEASPVTHAVPDDSKLSKPGSIGPAVPLTEAIVADPTTGAELSPGEPGEIWVRGPQVMQGYLGDPAATAEILDENGWLHTGDVGFADDDGWFTVVDRLKEMIKYKGCQIAPAELEAVLLAHPSVADAAVIGSPDEKAGEVPKGMVVLKGEATPEELLAHVATQVAPYKKLRRVELVDEIPKSPSGKILRRVLVERERAAARSRS